MNVFQKILSGIGITKRYHDIMRMWQEYSSFEARSMSRTDYLKEYKGWVFAAVSTIASRTASLDFHLVDAKGKQIDHDYLRLVTYDLVEQVASFMKLNGSCYVWKNTVGNRVLSLHALRPDLVSAKYDKSWSRITGYVYRVNGKEIPFRSEDIMAFHNFNPLQAYPFVTQWVGDVQAAAIAIDTDNASSVWNWKFFENSAKPHTAIEVPTAIDSDARERLESQWNNKYKGVNNSHKPVFLTGGMKIANFGPSQREMDFVESRRMSRDEILAIFKVPKAIIGLGEGGGQNMNIRPFEILMARNSIQPLAIKIQEVFSAGLFWSVGTFEFVNVVPHDSEEVRSDYDAGIITLNEARSARWYLPAKGGDSFKDTTPGTITIDKPKKALSASAAKSVAEIVERHVKWTESNSEAKWKAREERRKKHEAKVVSAIRTVAKRQRDEIIRKAERMKTAKADIPQIDYRKYQSLYYSLLKSAYVSIYEEEWQDAFGWTGVSGSFAVGDPEMTEIRDSILLMAKWVDTVTNGLIREAIVESMDAGEPVSAAMSRLSGTFDELEGYRSEMIARTETVTASNSASIRWWAQSWVVAEKEWWTAPGERTCWFCWSMHGRRVPLSRDFLELGSKLTVGDESMAVDYRPINGPSLHPNCMCTLIPVISK